MHTKLGEIAVKKGLITTDTLREALFIQQSGDEALGIIPGEKLGRIMLAKNYVEPIVLVRMLYEQLEKVDFIAVGSYIIEPRVMGWLPREVAEEFNILPLVSMDDSTLIVAANREISKEDVDAIDLKIKRSIEVVIVDDKELSTAIKDCYDLFRRRGTSGVRIGEILVRDGYVSQVEIDKALTESKKRQRLLGRVLIERGLVNEEDFFKILSLQKDLPLVLGRNILPMLDKGLIKNISRVFCLRNLIAPYKKEGDTIYVVTAEPSLNPEELCKTFKCSQLKLSLATYTDIETVLRALYMDRSLLESSADTFLDTEELEDIPIEEELNAPVVEDIGALTKRYQKFTAGLLLEAVKKRASDVHIESYPNNVSIRFRIDGTLYDVDYMQIDKKNVSGVVNVLKIQSGMNIAERRLPQNGRFRKKAGRGLMYDFRLQSQPTLYGENMIIRILNQSSQLLELDKLGFSLDIKEKYQELIKNPSGLIIITGPTGSGKTTTLYSTLEILRRDLRKKIITIEDPIEYSLDRIQQCQVKTEIGFDFASAIKSFLREDPDVILVGEVRDHETAIEAMRASQTGHMVLTTLHTNNTVESVQRLFDLGLNPGTIASELLAVVSQRLAKRNCDGCKKPYKPSKELLDSFYPLGLPTGLKFYKGAGCERCNYRGHKGRIAVIEFWLIDDESKHLILGRSDFDDILACAVRHGMLSMIRDAVNKVEAGIIPLDELVDILPYSDIVRYRDDLLRLKNI